MATPRSASRSALLVERVEALLLGIESTASYRSKPGGASLTRKMTSGVENRSFAEEPVVADLSELSLDPPMSW